MTFIYDRICAPLLSKLPPETAHNAALLALRAGLGPVFNADDAVLHTNVWGRTFRNPLGLAAGFDKNADALLPLLGMGFGHVEAGTVTPQPQPGNPKPRVFRHPEQGAIVNSMGFPGKGLAHFSRRLRAFRRHHSAHPGRIGVNIGFNKASLSPIEDYVALVTALSPHADYIAVNISSPNTPGLRDFQSVDRLDTLLQRLQNANANAHVGSKKSAPLLLKVSPDLNASMRTDIAALALHHGIDGLIVSNTTLARPKELGQGVAQEAGGLSGRPLRDMSL
jgi:dihydroorotate dehydrogenase